MIEVLYSLVISAMSNTVHNPTPLRSVPAANVNNALGVDDNPLETSSLPVNVEVEDETSTESDPLIIKSSKVTQAGSSRSKNEASSSFGFFRDPEMWPATNFPSNITTREELGVIMDAYDFPETHWLAAPRTSHRIYQRPSVEGETKGHFVGVSISAFKCGLRVPVNPFLIKLLKCLKCALGQLVPNSFTQIVTFLAHCKRRQVEPSLAYFFATFRINSNVQKGFYSISHRTGRPEWVEKNTSNKSWAREWVFLYGPELQDLPEFSPIDVKKFTPPGFTKAEAAEYAEFIRVQDNEPKWTKNDFESNTWLASNTGTLSSMRIYFCIQSFLTDYYCLCRVDSRAD